MSGIFGYCGLPDRDASTVASRMAGALRHMPYQRTETTDVAPGVTVGVHGHGAGGAPRGAARTPDGRLTAWLSGWLDDPGTWRADSDVARYAAAGTGGADVALALYRARGVDGLTALAGEFLVALWDEAARELLLVNDRYGLCPHYYWSAGGALAFAPEVKALRCAPGFRARLDGVAVAEYLRFQHLLGDRTWLEDVNLLPYGSVLRYRPGDRQPTVTRYWDWDRVPRLQATFGEAVELGAQVVTDAVTKRCGAGERVGVFLSGGLDGRLLAGTLAGTRPLTTLTFGHPGCRDVLYASRVARAVRSRHHVHPLMDGRWVLDHMPAHLALTEGFHSFVHMHGVSMLEEARARIDVNLTGWDGGTILRARVVEYDRDEPFRHYASEQDLERRLFDASCRDLTWPGLTDTEADRLTASTLPDLPRLAFDSHTDHVRRTACFDPDRRADYFIAQHHLRRLTSNMVVMARAAVDVRCPYFDYGLVDLSYGLPDAVRATPVYFRALLARLAPRLTWIPYEADLRLPHPNASVRWVHALPMRVAHRLRRWGLPAGLDRPRLYADYEEYLRADLREWAAGLLFDRRTAERGLFDQRAARALWERHLSGRELWTIGKIAPLIAIEQACRYLVDDDEAREAALGPVGG